jgi:hypothetical protein
VLEPAGRSRPQLDVTRGSYALPLAYGSALLLHLLFLKSLVYRLALPDFAVVLVAASTFGGLYLPTVVLQAAFAQHAARRDGSTPWLARLDRLLGVGSLVALGCGLCIAFVPGVRTVLHWPLLLAAITSPLIGAWAASTRVVHGALLGHERERWFAALTIAEPALRLAFALGLPRWCDDATAASIAMTAAPVITLLVGRALLPRRDATTPTSSARRPLEFQPRTWLTLAFAGTLSFIDVVFANIRLPPDEAARYVGLSAIARFPELLAAPLALALLTRTRLRVFTRDSPFPELWQSLGKVALWLAAAVAFTHLLGRDIVRLLLQTETFASVTPLLPRLVLGHALIAFAQTLLFFGIANGAVGMPLVPLTLLWSYAMLLAERGTTASHCAWTCVLIGALSVLFTAMVVIVPPLLAARTRRGPRPAK